MKFLLPLFQKKTMPKLYEYFGLIILFYSNEQEHSRICT